MNPSPEDGSAPAEFVLSSVLLVVLVLGVLQVGAAMLVRNTARDAVAEGARWAAVDGNTAEDGVERARQILTTSLSAAYAGDVTAGQTTFAGLPATEVTARIPLPVVGLFGPADTIEVSGHAALEPRDD